MSEKLIVLPNREEMRQRLNRVIDERHVDYLYTREHLFPYPLEHAGQRKSVMGVANFIVFAIEDSKKFLSSGTIGFLHLIKDEFVDVLVDDKKVAEETKTILRSL